jgi:hypothetical protein
MTLMRVVTVRVQGLLYGLGHGVLEEIYVVQVPETLE